MKFTKRAVASKDSNGGGNYLKLADGESVNVIFRGEVFEFWQSWPRGGEKQVFDKPTPGASSRFKANVVVHEAGKFVAKVWEFPVGIYNNIAEIADAYDITTTKIRITRRGVEKATIYILLPLAEKIPAKAMKEIEAVELNILGHAQAHAELSKPKNHAPGGDADEIPF